MDMNLDCRELARDACRALDEERECLNEMARKVEGYGRLFDAAMNTDHLIWNGSISQRFLPHKQLTVSLRAVDILNERDDVNRNISATSRTDTRNEMIRSYVLLSANWRFGRFGGRGGGRGRGEGGRSERLRRRSSRRQVLGHAESIISLDFVCF